LLLDTFPILEIYRNAFLAGALPGTPLHSPDFLAGLGSHFWQRGGKGRITKMKGKEKEATDESNRGLTPKRVGCAMRKLSVHMPTLFFVEK